MAKLGTKNLIRLFAVVAIIVTAVFAAGCAEISVYDYTSGGTRYNVYTLDIDADTVSRMERTASTDTDGNKYTVDGYFRDLFKRFGYEVTSATALGGAFSATFEKAFAAGQPTELDECGTKLEYIAEYADGPFVRDITLTAANPFNGVRAAYDAVLPNRTVTTVERLKNGFGAYNERGEWVTELPAPTDAFPYLKGVDLDGLLLRYMMSGSSRMNSSGTAVRLDSDRSRYAFERYFDNTDSKIYFSYKRPISYGWYLVAVAAGGITVAVIAAVVYRKKRKASPAAPDAGTLDVVADATAATPEIEPQHQDATDNNEN